MKKGTLTGTYNGPYREEMEKRLEVDFAWKLLSGDILEDKGILKDAEVRKSNGKPQTWEPFLRNVVDATGMSEEFVGQKLKKLAEKGFIACRRVPEGFHWEWRELNRDRSPLQNTPPLQ